MGYLTSGALAGMSGEYLKQSGEDREFKKQAIRDKRLSGLKMKEETHRQKLAGEREAAAYEREKGDYTAGYGDKIYRGGKLVAEGRDRPTSSSTKPTGNLIQLKTGDKVTYDDLRKSYADIAKANRDEFGNPIGDFDLPSWDEWWNSQVAEMHMRDLPPPPPEAPESTEEDQGWWAGLVEKFTGGDEEPEGRGGMLSEQPPASERQTARIKLKSPLTREARNDPVQMYDELNAQLMSDPNVSEQDLIDTIRAHFGIPDWQPPADALK